MPNIDAQRLFTDTLYKTSVIEYYKFATYVLSNINTTYSIRSSSYRFCDESIIPELIIQMLQETFPTFTITHEKNDDEHTITVSWT